MGTRVLVVQHGEKVREPGDPGLTATGRRQAAEAASWVADTFEIAGVWASCLRRAIETAQPLADAVGVAVEIDPRLRERMNWEGDDHQTIDAFLDEWQRATSDRSYVPTCGDSSEHAAARFLDAITDIADSVQDGATVAVVAHGGVTVDTLRTIVGDDHLRTHAATLIPDGVPCGAVTVLEHRHGTWHLQHLPSTSHLREGSEHRPA